MPHKSRGTGKIKGFTELFSPHGTKAQSPLKQAGWKGAILPHGSPFFPSETGEGGEITSGSNDDTALRPTTFPAFFLSPEQSARPRAARAPRGKSQTDPASPPGVVFYRQCARDASQSEGGEGRGRLPLSPSVTRRCLSKAGRRDGGRCYPITGEKQRRRRR